jgi:hypothetical protein
MLTCTACIALIGSRTGFPVTKVPTLCGEEFLPVGGAGSAALCDEETSQVGSAGFDVASLVLHVSSFSASGLLIKTGFAYCTCMCSVKQSSTQ